MKMSASMVILYFFLYSVTARKYVSEYTVGDASLKEDTAKTILDGEAENMLSSDTGAEHYPFVTGLVSYKCLECICKLESKCQPLGCRKDVGTLSCGYFQIKKPYWTDCGKPGGDLETCGKNATCSSGCVQKYMARYAGGTGCPKTCETYAREHNGGPQGCKHSNTLKYWEKLKEIPGCENMDV